MLTFLIQAEFCENQVLIQLDLVPNSLESDLFAFKFESTFPPDSFFQSDPVFKRERERERDRERVSERKKLTAATSGVILWAPGRGSYVNIISATYDPIKWFPFPINSIGIRYFWTKAIDPSNPCDFFRFFKKTLVKKERKRRSEREREKKESGGEREKIQFLQEMGQSAKQLG